VGRSDGEGGARAEAAGAEVVGASWRLEQLGSA
jgi:hypothetical protein